MKVIKTQDGSILNIESVESISHLNGVTTITMNSGDKFFDSRTPDKLVESSLKTHIKFDHTKKNLSDAMNLKTESVAIVMATTVGEYIKSDNMGTLSELAEMIHERVPYEVMLFSCTMQMVDVLKKGDNKDLFDSLFNNN